eukprot:gb/GECH01008557.1/.p1 GENE.gb/GECH01008557.1/~~gb/GECH01008557.1/.p1  ORF type:complete len:849 (+),score=112.80 gb/GECH01008557.1/:1-2547(+)
MDHLRSLSIRSAPLEDDQGDNVASSTETTNHSRHTANTARLRSINKSWVLVIRKAFITYSAVLAGLLTLILGNNLGLQLFYTFHHIDMDSKYNQAEKLGKEVCLVGFLFMGSFAFSMFLAKCFQLAQTVWKTNQFGDITKKVISFFHAFGVTEKNRLIETSIQLFFIILFDVVPILLAVIFGFIERSFAFAIQMLMSAATFAAGFVVCIWWLGNILENYKRLVLFFLKKKDSLIEAPASRLSERYPHQSEFDRQLSTNRRLSDASLSTTSTASADHDDEDEEQDVTSTGNLCLCLFQYCWSANLPLPSCCQRKTTCSVKWIWGGIFLLGLFVISIVLGAFNSWPLFAVCFSIFICATLEYFYQLFVSFPSRKPSRIAVERAWHRSFISRYVAVFEEVFYFSPSVVFGICRLLSYLCTTTISIMIAIGLYDAILYFSIPLVFFGIVMIIYSLRAVIVPRNEEEGLVALGMPSEFPFLRKLSVLTFSVGMFTGMILLNLFCFIFLGAGPGFVFMALELVTCFVVFKRHEPSADMALLGFNLFFIFIMGTIFIIGSVHNTLPESGTHAQTGHHVQGLEDPYDVCQMEWHGYGILDYGYFCVLTYEEGDTFDKDLNTWFGSCDNCSVVYSYNQTVAFYDYYIPEKNLSIIAVRGTALLRDWVEDVDIWSEVGLLQLASMFGPFLTFWPQNLTVNIIASTSTLKKSFGGNNRYYYDKLLSYTKDVMNDREVILTGHSLGGGLAKIVGARLGIKAITFSSPGVVLSRKKLGIDSLDTISRTTLTIKPSHDLVPKVDELGGIVQDIDCDADAISCHSILRTTRELTRVCGNDAAGRYVRLNDEPIHPKNSSTPSI